MNNKRNTFGVGKPNIEGLLKSRNIESLIEALHHNDSEVRYSAAFALGQIGDAKAFEPVTTAIEQGRVRIDKYSWIIFKLQGAYAAESIVKLLENGDTDGAIDALRNIGDFIAASYAIGALAEKNRPWLNDFLIKAFFEGHFTEDVIFILERRGEIPLDLVFPTISCNVLIQPNYDNDRVKIAFLLGLIPSNKLMVIAEYRGNYFRDRYVSDIAMDILRKPSNRKNLPQLLDKCIGVLKNGTYQTRLKAIEILDMIGDPSAIEQLREAAQNDQGLFIPMNSNDLSEGRTEYQIRDKAKGVIARLSNREHLVEITQSPKTSPVSATSVSAPAIPLQSTPKSTPVRIVASNKSPFLAALLSYFLLGGAGQIYLGQWKKGLALMISTFFLSFVLVGILIPIIGIGDAYGIAQKMSSGNSVGEWEFNINWKASALVLIIYAIAFCGIVFLAYLGSSR